MSITFLNGCNGFETIRCNVQVQEVRIINGQEWVRGRMACHDYSFTKDKLGRITKSKLYRLSDVDGMWGVPKAEFPKVNGKIGEGWEFAVDKGYLR